MGETLVEPLKATEPTPLSIVTEVALLELQVRVADCPLVIEVGLADRVIVGCVVVLETLMFTEFLVTAPAVSQN